MFININASYVRFILLLTLRIFSDEFNTRFKYSAFDPFENCNIRIYALLKKKGSCEIRRLS
jgi:hypothetical protein